MSKRRDRWRGGREQMGIGERAQEKNTVMKGGARSRGRKRDDPKRGETLVRGAGTLQGSVQCRWGVERGSRGCRRRYSMR